MIVEFNKNGLARQNKCVCLAYLNTRITDENHSNTSRSDAPKQNYFNWTKWNNFN